MRSNTHTHPHERGEHIQSARKVRLAVKTERWRWAGWGRDRGHGRPCAAIDGFQGCSRHSSREALKRRWLSGYLSAHPLWPPHAQQTCCPTLPTSLKASVSSPSSAFNHSDIKPTNIAYNLNQFGLDSIGACALASSSVGFSWPKK